MGGGGQFRRPPVFLLAERTADRNHRYCTMTPTVTPTPTATPTTVPTCEELNPTSMIVTIGKSQSPTDNPKVSHAISGHIVDPGSLKDTAQRIPVCAGTEVTIVVPVLAGTSINTTGGNLSCVLLSVVVLCAKSISASRDIGQNSVSENI